MCHYFLFIQGSRIFMKVKLFKLGYKLGDDGGKVPKGSPVVMGLIPSSKISFPPNANLAMSGKKVTHVYQKQKRKYCRKLLREMWTLLQPAGQVALGTGSKGNGGNANSSTTIGGCATGTSTTRTSAARSHSTRRGHNNQIG